jgi:hypothetical protein
VSAVGWWLVPVLAAVWVRVLPRAGGRAVTCGLGAACGWASLLTWDAASGPAGAVARRVGGLFLMPGWAFVAVTLLFGGLLGATGAIAASRTRRW